VESPEICPHCNKLFVSWRSKMPKEVSVSEDLSYQCAACLRDYRDYPNTQQKLPQDDFLGLSREQTVVQTPETCPHCNKRFVSWRSKMPKEASVSEDLNYQCAQCMKDYRDYRGHPDDRGVEQKVPLSPRLQMVGTGLIKDGVEFRCPVCQHNQFSEGRAVLIKLGPILSRYNFNKKYATFYASHNCGFLNWCSDE
jgi:DNA-directed RNA polymerase subunit RPC12/RpoP